LIPLLLALAASAPTAAPASADEARFRTCTGLVRTAPEKALADAGDWQARGGGVHARECLGLAEAALERWPAAAATFELAAREAQAALDPSAADLWVQSGNAWLAGGDPAKARAAFDSALGSTILSGELRGEVHIDRARASVALEDLPAARRDLDKAIELVPGDGFAWYLSAALARRQRDLHRAQEHIARAVALAPDDSEILLEAGTIAGLSGEVEAARGLYARAARAAPDSDAGRRAAAALAANGGEAAGQPPRQD
jgi:tetratricopeptide (TPR) repeat protein